MSRWTSDNELLRASLTGDKEAFGVIVRRYQSLVCALTYSATGDVHRSEELAQETFIRAWRSLSRLGDVGRFRAWLCVIARNLCAQSIRDGARAAVDAANLQQKARLHSVSPDPGQAAIDKERREIVWAAVRGIPKRYREPLVLFYRRQHSVSEVAADLGLSQELVRQRLHRGRQLIKAEVSSLVEDTLAHSGPGKVFAVAVIAALPAITTQTTSAAVAGIAAKGTPAAKTVFAAGLSGAILGPIVGLLGGILGAWCSIKNTNSPRERRFMIRWSIFFWLLLFVLGGLPLALALAGLVPKWTCWLCCGAFFVLLGPIILWSNARQREIRIQDGTCRQPEYVPRITRRRAYGSLGGGIFGGTAWLVVLTVLARDWAPFALILACDALLLWGAASAIGRDPKRYWPVVLITLGAIGALTLIAVNLRWTVWMHAYRQSAAYDPRNDVSPTTINLIVLGLFVALFALVATQYTRRKAARGNPVSKDRKTNAMDTDSERP